MTPLSTQFEDRNFVYEQLAREGMIALYSQTHKEGGQVRYEVVRIHEAKEHTWPNGMTTPEHEAYPGAGLWGREGFTYFSREDAEQHMARWVAQHAEKEVVSDQSDGDGSRSQA